MRRSNWTPSIIPSENDETVDLVGDDFGRIGHAWRETEYEATDLETDIGDLLGGQYTTPIRVVAFNTAERWSQDVSEDVARRQVPRLLILTREPTGISAVAQVSRERWASYLDGAVRKACQSNLDGNRRPTSVHQGY